MARLFQRLGAVVVSADEAAREAVEPGQPALREIEALFGAGVLLPDGTLDRRGLGDIIFNDETARRRLEEITHPRIRHIMRTQMDAAADAGDTVIAEIPLLFESEPARALVDVTVVVYADADVQRARLIARDGLTEAEADARIAAQLPLADKIARADYVIDNGDSEERTGEQVKSVWEQLHRDQELKR